MDVNNPPNWIKATAFFVMAAIAIGLELGRAGLKAFGVKKHQ